MDRNAVHFGRPLPVFLQSPQLLHGDKVGVEKDGSSGRGKDALGAPIGDGVARKRQMCRGQM
jgi:hypothetical protein